MHTLPRLHCMPCLVWATSFHKRDIPYALTLPAMRCHLRDHKTTCSANCNSFYTREAETVTWDNDTLAYTSADLAGGYGGVCEYFPQCGLVQTSGACSGDDRRVMQTLTERSRMISEKGGKMALPRDTSEQRWLNGFNPPLFLTPYFKCIHSHLWADSHDDNDLTSCNASVSHTRESITTKTQGKQEAGGYIHYEARA